MRKRPTLVAVVTVAIAVLMCAGVAIARDASTNDVRLKSRGGEDSHSASFGNVESGGLLSAFAGSVCLTSQGSATITAVRPVKPQGGLEVTDFVLYGGDPDRAVLGASDRRVADEPAFKGTKTLRTECGNGYRDIALELHGPGAAAASAEDFRISYVAEGKHHEATISFPNDPVLAG